jgi:hypothetical protein
MKDFADLALQRVGLAHQVAALADEHLQVQVVLGPWRIDEAEAVDRRPKDAGQVGVVSFVARIGGLTVLGRSKGMHEANIEPALPEKLLHGPMVGASAFDGHEEVAELVALEASWRQACMARNAFC